VAVIVLAVLAVGLGGLSVVNSRRLSSRNTDLAQVRRDLAAAQAKLTDANRARADQSSQLGAYKTCITDLNILFNTTANTPAETAANRQAQKDCLLVGLG
jgi:hypothetical protein